VIFCGSDEIASGAQKAIANGGWTVGEDYYLLGIGGRDGAVQMVLNGTLTATVSEGGQKQGQKILELAQKLQNEEAVEKYSYIEPEVITAGNAK
jgi:ABC-type sugar transport system substrate-binding protein